jgi:hypothetical protein
MQVAHLTARPPHLVQALAALAQRDSYREEAENLLQDLSGITLLVANKFTNNRTADGMLEAFYLTVGCVSLGISQAKLPDSDAAKLSFLLHHGAEYVFQMGFRHIKELSALPYVAYVSDFDNDPFVQQRNVKALFVEICRADPNLDWDGDEVFSRELQDRKANLKVVECAKWLRKKHVGGPVKDSDLDANSVIALVVIFGILGDGRIVARTGQKDIENLIKVARATQCDAETGWGILLEKIPGEYQAILRERMDDYKKTIIKKVLSKAKAKTILMEIQDFYAGNELDIDYP